MSETEILVSLAGWLCALVVAGLVASVLRRKLFNPVWFAAAACLMAVNVLLILDPLALYALLYQLVGAEGASANWAGKVVALAFSLVLIALVPAFRPPSRVGLILRQERHAWIGWAVVALLVATDLVIALQLDNDRHSAGIIAYQLTMPSLEEEIFWRGLFLLALTKAFDDQPRLGCRHFGWGAVLSALMFGTLHATGWGSASGWYFSLEAFLFAGLIGLVLTWLRANTGSLLAPILLHSVINTLWRIV